MTTMARGNGPSVTFKHRGIIGVDAALVTLLRPDVVICEVVERNLDAFLNPELH